MNLHQWITEQVDRVEAENRPIALVPNSGKPIIGAITGAVRTDDGIELTVLPGETNSAVLRRCEADRRILARHTLPQPGDWMYPGCAGCGTHGDCDDPVTDNINDCPELLDLAHAHGITEEQLAGLHRLERVGTAPVVPFYGTTATQPITPDQIPAALRGRHWRPGHHH